MHLSWQPVSVLWGTIALLVLAAALVLAWTRASRAGIGTRTRALFILRLIVAVAVAGFLFRPCFHIIVRGRLPVDLLVLWDRSESMRLAVAGQDTLTRLDAAVRWWDHVRTELERIQGLQIRHAAFAESLTAAAVPADLPKSSPGKATDIRRALEQAVRMVHDGGRVLLVTDGCHNTGASPAQVARLSRIPIDVVVPWEVGDEADLRIDDLVGRRVVSPGDTVEVRAVVRWEALPQSDSVAIFLERDGVTVDSLAFGVRAGWGERDVLLASPMPAEGTSLLRATLRGRIDSTPGNDSRALSVEVVRKTHTIALLASAPHPDYGALRRFLERDASVALVGGVLDRDGSLAGGGVPSEALRPADVIVVVSSSDNPLPPELCRQVAASVRSGAKGLLWIGAMPPRASPLATVLPGEALGQGRDLQQVGPEAKTLARSFLGSATAEWDRVPPLTVNTSAHALAGSYVPLVGQADGLPVVLLTSGAVERAAWINTYTLWRWFLDDAAVALSGSLVERLLAWLGQQGGPVRVDLSQVSDVLVAEAQVYDPDWRPWEGCSVTLAISDSTGRRLAAVDVGAVAGAPGSYRGRTGPLPPGRHLYTLTVRRGEAAVASDEGWVHVQPSTAELADAVPCTGTLRGIARASGGRYYDVHDATEWASTLERQGTQRVSLCPWRGGWWALAALVLLSVEWYVRRRMGLS